MVRRTNYDVYTNGKFTLLRLNNDVRSFHCDYYTESMSYKGIDLVIDMDLFPLVAWRYVMVMFGSISVQPKPVICIVERPYYMLYLSLQVLQVIISKQISSIQ